MKVFVFLLLGFLSLLSNASIDSEKHCQQADAMHSAVVLSVDMPEHQDCPQCALTYFAVNKVLQVFVFIDEALVESKPIRIYTSRPSKVDNPPPINS